jgi:hypothetical protein
MRAGLTGMRLHDLRHTYASFGAGGGFGLPYHWKAAGPFSVSTTARYAHLDNDPLPRASEASAGRNNAFASSHGARIQTSRPSSVVRITGMA